MVAKSAAVAWPMPEPAPVITYRIQVEGYVGESWSDSLLYELYLPILSVEILEEVTDS